MIEKLKITASDTAIMLKINELVDAVNMLQLAKDAMFYTIRNIQNRIAALDDPTYHKEPADNSEKANCQENVPGPIKLYVCADGSVYGNENVAKSHAASISNQLPTGATTTDRAYLEQELERTREALDVAKRALRELKDIIACPPDISYETGVSMYADGALQEITALTKGGDNE